MVVGGKVTSDLGGPGVLGTVTTGDGVILGLLDGGHDVEVLAAEGNNPGRGRRIRRIRRAINYNLHN